MLDFFDLGVLDLKKLLVCESHLASYVDCEHNMRSMYLNAQ
jgi:hypothetical protein